MQTQDECERIAEWDREMDKRNPCNDAEEVDPDDFDELSWEVTKHE